MCQTLLNAFDRSRNTPMTSYPSSNDLKISRVIDSIWLIQKSPGLNSEWFVAINLFLIKNWNILSKISFSRIFPQMEDRLYSSVVFLSIVYHRCYELAQCFPFFTPRETNRRHSLLMISDGLQIELPKFLSMRILILS